MEFLTAYGLFIAKFATVVAIIVFAMVIIFSMSGRGRRQPKGHIEITPLNDTIAEMRNTLREAILDPRQLKVEMKREKKQRKAREKREKATEQNSEPPRSRLFVLNFKGDLRASAVTSLREEVTAVLGHARQIDEVVVRLESAGGLVHSYGLAASQVDRIRKLGIPLTVCVDKVAASGGYMVACVADRILAAPFAMLGSIGVLAQLPNFHRLLQKHDIDYELLTAGEYKRTLTLFGENTDHGREKFIEELEQTHKLFKGFVKRHRPKLDVESVATGEVWLGEQAIEKGLIDELMTSDEYLVSRIDDVDLYEVQYILKKSLSEKLGMAAENSSDRLLLRWWQRFTQPSYWGL